MAMIKAAIFTSQGDGVLKVGGTKRRNHHGVLGA